MLRTVRSNSFGNIVMYFRSAIFLSVLSASNAPAAVCHSSKLIS